MQAMIRNWSMQNKLLLLLALPLLFLCWFVGQHMWVQYGELKVARDVELKVQQTLVLGALVNGLQAERGSSGVFLGSKGSKFADKKQQARNDTNTKLQPFLALQDDSLTQAQQAMQQLEPLRRDVDAQSIKNTESAERYTRLISQLLAVSHQAEQQLRHRDMARQLAVMNQLMEMI